MMFMKTYFEGEINMPKYEVTITYSFTVDAKYEEDAETKAFELMEDCQPRIEVSELDEED